MARAHPRAVWAWVQGAGGPGCEVVGESQPPACPAKLWGRLDQAEQEERLEFAEGPQEERDL